MAKKGPGYRQSIEEVECILSKIERGETDLEDLSGEIQRAAKLLKECKEKLFKTEKEVEQMMAED